MSIYKQKLAMVIMIIVAAKGSQAQFTFQSGNQSMELSGVLAVDYNYRFHKQDPASPDYSKDRFELNTARIKFEGRQGNNYEYQVQFDLSRIGLSGSSGEYPTVLDVNFTYKKFKLFNIIAGYQKLPYSRSSLSSYQYQPYWQRAELTRGHIFSRRDIGVTLQKEFWRQRINLMAGAYSGQGEAILTADTKGDGDIKGMPEFVGRATFSYPCRYKENEIYDTRNVAAPMFSLGVNGRYLERSTDPVPAGTNDFDLKYIPGKRTIYGFDLAAQYHGFSFLFEMHTLRINPMNKTLLFDRETDHFNAGGIIAQLAYYNKKLKSGLLARYDDFIPNDLQSVNYKLRNVSVTYNYMLNGFKSMLRVQYWYRLDKDGPYFSKKYHDDQLRAGWQFVF